MESGTNTSTHKPEPPKIESDVGALPSALTFFVTLAQRRALLKALGAWSPDRTRALLMALGVVDMDDEPMNGEREDG